MKKLIHYLFAITVSVAASLPCWADFTQGEGLQQYLSVCLDKEDAIRIVDAHADKGIEAAGALFVAAERCNNVPVVAASVGRVVHKREVTKDGKKVTSSVVEIVAGDGSIPGYFLTTQPVHEKPDRNS
jgi:hypothetical protein